MSNPDDVEVNSKLKISILISYHCSNGSGKSSIDVDSDDDNVVNEIDDDDDTSSDSLWSPAKQGSC